LRFWILAPVERISGRTGQTVLKITDKHLVKCCHTKFGSAGFSEWSAVKRADFQTKAGQMSRQVSASKILRTSRLSAEQAELRQHLRIGYFRECFWRLVSNLQIHWVGLRTLPSGICEGKR
jgi:hypothetical protein